MNAAEREALCRHYELGSPTGYQRAGGTRNDNSLLETNRGKFFVRRRYCGYSAPARIAFDHRAMQFLRACDVPVAAPRKASNGATFWTHNDRVFEVFPALSGRHLRDGDERDVRLLAAALTGFHRAARSFEGRFEKVSPRGETDPDLLRATALTFCEQSRECAAAVRTYEQWIDAACTELDAAAFSRLPHTLVHGDIQPANVLIDGDHVAGFVDFDWCAWRPRIYDLAFAILMCCSTHETPIKGGDIWSLSQGVRVQPRLLRRFLDACAEAGWPLEKCEEEALGAQVLLSWCSCRLAGALKVEPSRWAEFLRRPPHDRKSLFPSPFA